MTVTSTQTHEGGVANIALGRYLDTGTAAAFTITVGFQPRYVHVSNQTPGADLTWYEGMAANSAEKRVIAGDKTLITSNGITVAEKGFTVGLDTDTNKDNEQVNWIVFG